ncbi:unnamed protein product [Strongylus vulgaris]|uniref:Uncharacterized protein n=1 Tax=Strongylus vulgaris TaxID=40348 RepID=A0A3P7IZ12_STRVU|nr:unnamed protein product [Strongylus vulgaris]
MLFALLLLALICSTTVNAGQPRRNSTEKGHPPMGRQRGAGGPNGQNAPPMGGQGGPGRGPRGGAGQQSQKQ